MAKEATKGLVSPPLPVLNAPSPWLPSTPTRTTSPSTYCVSSGVMFPAPPRPCDTSGAAISRNPFRLVVFSSADRGLWASARAADGGWDGTESRALSALPGNHGLAVYGVAELGQVARGKVRYEVRGTRHEARVSCYISSELCMSATPGSNSHAGTWMARDREGVSPYFCGPYLLSGIHG